MSPGAGPLRARERWIVAATLVAALLVWLPALRCGFTIWDDGAFVLWNADVARLDLLRVLDPRTRVLGDWTPLATVTYAAERWALGESAWVPHATNLALHLAAVWLVLRLLRDAGFDAWTGAAIALVFAVHPLQAESVVWVSARKNLLVAVFAFAFLRSFLAGRHVRATWWLLLALCSKATAVGLPVAAAAALLLGIGPVSGGAADGPSRAPGDGAPSPAPPRSRAPSPADWAWIAVWLVPCALRAWLSIDAQADQISRTAALGLSGRLAVMGSVLTTQARQVLLPTDLSVLYDPPRRAWDDPVLLGQWTLLAAVLAGAFVLARRDRRVAWLGVLALAMLAPTLNVFPGPAWQADRYLHLPLFGIGAVLVAAVRAAAAPLGRARTWLPAAVVAAWIGAVLVPLTLARQSDWRDHVSLFEATVRTTPTSAIAWNQLGLGRMERGEHAAAASAYARARDLDPRDPFVALNLAIALLAGRRDAEAERVVRDVLSFAPGNGDARALLGVIAARAGRRDDAAREFAEALRLAPDSANVRRWAAEHR